MVPGYRSFSVLLAVVFAFPSLSAEEEGKLTGDLDPLIRLPDAYLLKPTDLEALYEQGTWNRNPYFQWLTEDKSRAVFQRKETGSLTVDLTLLGGTVPIEEAIVDFKDGEFLGITISIFNRGDGGTISKPDFEARNRAMGRHLGEQLAVRPTRKVENPAQGLLTSGWVWISARGKAVLEHNPAAPDQTEFLRMRLARRDAGGAYEAATKDRAGATVTLSQLPANVKRNPGGDVFVTGVPMVDQGAKGYCVVASAQRVFEYYGIACDMHQLAQIANSDPNRGTSALVINEELGAIDHLFKTRFECLAIRHSTGLVELIDDRYVGEHVPEDDFYKMISKWIGEGIPLLWALEVGRFPEEPPLLEQTAGGHMRMIIGYNHETDRIIFSDSWGAGHEFKTMNASDAYRATSGLFLLKPTVR